MAEVSGLTEGRYLADYGLASSSFLEIYKYR